MRDSAVTSWPIPASMETARLPVPPVAPVTATGPLPGASPFNAVRVGLLQFGILPHPHSLLAQVRTEPVFSFHTRVGLVKTLPRGKFSRDLEALRSLAEERHVAGIVLGLPLNMDGSEGPRAQSARAYARNLAPLTVPVLLWDERWSTASAERDLIAQDVSRARRAERIDSHAAAVILQAALDALAGGMF